MTLTPLSQRAARVFAHLTRDLNRIGDARRFDTARGTFMAVSVERIGRHTFSISHYGEQNGDLMADPDMTFYRDPASGCVYPMTFRNDYVHVHQEAAWLTSNETSIERFRPKLMRELATFAAQWFVNINEQQNLKETL